MQTSMAWTASEAAGPQRHAAMQRGNRKKLHLALRHARLLDQAAQLETSVRAKFEHPFDVVKNSFLHRKTHYIGLAKNQAQLLSLTNRPMLTAIEEHAERDTATAEHLRKLLGDLGPITGVWHGALEAAGVARSELFKDRPERLPRAQEWVKMSRGTRCASEALTTSAAKSVWVMSIMS